MIFWLVTSPDALPLTAKIYKIPLLVCKLRFSQGTSNKHNNCYFRQIVGILL